MEPISLSIAAAGLVKTIWGMVSAPRGDFQKFSRTLLPYAARQANMTGIPVLILWFGDMLRVAPDGSFGIIVPKDTVHSTWTDLTPAIFVQEWANRVEPVYIVIGPEGNDHVNNSQATIFGLLEPDPNFNYETGDIRPEFTKTYASAAKDVAESDITFAGFASESLLSVLAFGGLSILAFFTFRKAGRIGK